MRRSQPTSWLHLLLVPGTEKTGGPKLETHTINLAGAAPKIALAARFPNAGDHNDVFAEASGGIYLPPPKRLDAEAGGIVHYEIDLAGLDLAELKGKTVTVTLVSDAVRPRAVSRSTDLCLCHLRLTCGLVGSPCRDKLFRHNCSTIIGLERYAHDNHRR